MDERKTGQQRRREARHGGLSRNSTAVFYVCAACDTCSPLLMPDSGIDAGQKFPLYLTTGCCPKSHQAPQAARRATSEEYTEALMLLMEGAHADLKGLLDSLPGVLVDTLPYMEGGITKPPELGDGPGVEVRDLGA